MTLVVASQLDPDLNQALAAALPHLHLIEASADAPWQVADRADVLVVRPTPQWRALRTAPAPEQWPGRLRWVFSASAGIDFYPEWLLDAPLVTCGRGTASDEIADYVIAAIYLRAKDLDSARVRAAAEWRYRPLGRVIGATVGILGFGAIGREVARRALALGAQVQAVRRSSGSATDVPPGVVLRATVREVVADADHLVIALPATRETRGLFDQELFAQVKPGAHLINIARGSIVDQEALLAALDSGRLDFATLDVTEPEPLPEGHPLYTHARVRLTPHISSNYTAVRHRLVGKIVEDVRRFVRGEAPGDVVDPARGY